VIRDAIRIPRGKTMRVGFMGNDVRKIYIVFMKATQHTVPINDTEVEIDVRDLIAFLGKFSTIKMNPAIKNLEATLHYSLEYDQLLQDVGFQKVTIKFYKFPKTLITAGVEFDYDKLPETYCMLIY